jgi:uncharacterized protein with HEPN domain
MYDKELIIDIIDDMIDAATKVDNRCQKVDCSDDFLKNEEYQIILDSICMQLIAIGEATKEIDKLTNKTLFQNYRQVEWKRVAGIRDILSHHYFDLNAEIVFSVCENHIATLKNTLLEIKSDLVNEIRDGV